MDDVDWVRWAHSIPGSRDGKQCGQSDQLEFRRKSGVGGGLASVLVKCSSCNSSRSLEGLVGPHGPKSVGMRCRGRQPWQFSKDAGDCTYEVSIVQRGASNVYFPKVGSALDIPPFLELAGMGW